MTRAALLAGSALVALAAPAVAQEAGSADEPRPALAEVMQGATAMAALGSGYLMISNAEGGWICAINVSSNHFVALRDGDDVVAEQTVPGALCVPASHFKNLAE
ncbi:MAG: hypothetical protein KDK28_10800 [Maritimibacter sp.]|nr:hypothetical protein [Maritimibacter sp.]